MKNYTVSYKVFLLIGVTFVAALLVQSGHADNVDQEKRKHEEKMSSLRAKKAELDAKKDQKVAKMNADMRYKKAKVAAEHQKDMARIERKKDSEADKMHTLYHSDSYSNQEAINNVLRASDTSLLR